MKLILLTLLALAMTSADKMIGEKLLLRGSSHFTARMFSEVVKTKPEESVVMSASSVLTPLAQLSLATEGSSHDELLKAIGMPNDNATKEAFWVMKNTLRSLQGVDLKMASRIFVLNGYELYEDFQNLSRDLFGSDVKNVDFVKNVETAKDINAWVEEQTNNRIKDLVDPDSLDDSTRAVLANAVYFKGNWEHPFDKILTINGDFYVSKNKTVKVSIMRATGEYDYGYSEELQAELLRLPYEGGEAWMLFVLPREIDGLAALEEKLKDPDALISASRQMFLHDIIVRIPKFKIETTTDLKQVFKNMKVSRIFDENNAQLNKILKSLKNVLYVSEARQKAFIEVNEEGSEGGAANDMFLMEKSIPPDFTADRPFYFEVQARPTSTSEEYITLFNGVYKA